MDEQAVPAALAEEQRKRLEEAIQLMLNRLEKIEVTVEKGLFTARKAVG